MSYQKSPNRALENDVTRFMQARWLSLTLNKWHTGTLTTYNNL